MSFEYGSTLAFTMLENYYITDLNDNPITSITFTEEDPTYDKETDYYYFCHDKDGNTYYAKTYSEHLRNCDKAGL